MRVVSVRQRTARKKHRCNACLYLFYSDHRNLGATISEYRAIINALRCNGTIVKGEKYEAVTVEHMGEIVQIQHKPEIDAICQKYDLYPQ